MRIVEDTRELFAHLRFLFPLRKINANALVSDFSEELNDFIRTNLSPASTYVEYGGGASTILAAQAGAEVFSCETDYRFIDALSHLENVHFLNPLIGRVGPWGTRIFEPWRKNRELYGQLYANIVWNLHPTLQPNLVLLDGRFRLACALEVIKRFQGSELLMIFDDYETRAEYSGIEKWANKEFNIGRSAVFRINSGSVDLSGLQEDLKEAYSDYR